MPVPIEYSMQSLQFIPSILYMSSFELRPVLSNRSRYFCKVRKLIVGLTKGIEVLGMVDQNIYPILHKISQRYVHMMKTTITIRLNRRQSRSGRNTAVSIEGGAQI